MCLYDLLVCYAYICILLTLKALYKQQTNQLCSNLSFIIYFYWTCICFDAVGWVAGRASACKKLSGGMLHSCLGRDANLRMAQLMPLLLTISCSSKFREPWNGCSSSCSRHTCVCVYCSELMPVQWVS